MPVPHDAVWTLCLAAAAGVILVILSERLRVPSIVLLLLVGVVLGPSVLGWIDPAALGENLEVVIALAVAVILFEGGLTLDVAGYRRTSRVIRRMVTVGPVITWLGTTAAVFFLFDVSPGLALVAGSLVIVTGPTVIAPLLRRVHVKEQLHHILYWESVLIDPLGVFVAVLCYEWLTPGEVQSVFGPVGRFGLRLLVGLGVGVSLGLVMASVLRRSWVAEEHVNIFVLGGALLTFGVSHAILTESGLLAVVAAGLVIGLYHPPQLRYVRRFKLELTEFGIGLAFVLLAARLELERFTTWRLLAVVAVVILLVRPAVVWLATWGRRFKLREKIFLSWIGPRGIVAAAMASLFAIRLQDLGHPEAVHLETITYAVIATTVTLQGLSAPSVVRLLGVERVDRRAWVLLGRSGVVAGLGRGLRRAGVRVIELPGIDPTHIAEELEDPRFADAHSILCLERAALESIPAVLRGADVEEDRCFYWGAATDDDRSSEGAELVGSKVWGKTKSGVQVTQGIASGTLAIDVIEVSDPQESGYFGPDFQPLFWVRDGHATIVPDPLQPGPPQGDLAVVLRRRIPALFDLIAHVDVLSDAAPTFEAVVRESLKTAKRLHPELPVETLVAGILERHRTMSVAVGSGVVIPHAYCEGLERSRCFVVNVPNGVKMHTPDERPVHLVFLVLSPLGGARTHLDSLASLAKLAQDQEFLALMKRQRVPERLARLIVERG